MEIKNIGHLKLKTVQQKNKSECRNMYYLMTAGKAKTCCNV
jgi:hypothetical protein